MKAQAAVKMRRRGTAVGRAERLVVSICGPSGSGKSNLAKGLVERLGPETASRVPGDYFIVPRPAEEPLELYFRRALEYDWALLGRSVDGRDSEVVTTPDFDFERFVRRADVGGRAFGVRPVMLVDAMYPYPGADVTVLIEAPEAERLRRVEARDVAWRTAVAGRWHHLEAARARLEELTAGATLDLVLQGDAPLEENVESAAALIRERLGQGA